MGTIRASSPTSRRRARAGAGGRKRQAKFVIRQRAARRVSYEVHLEVAGRLRSWNLPHGLSADPREKRLAMAAGEHPREHADFEGMVPEEEGGGGAVIVWDRGAYRDLTQRNGDAVPIERALADGHALVWLEGEKLRGGYAFTRIAGAEPERWLIVKHRDEEARAGRDAARSSPQSVLSGKTVQEVDSEARSRAAVCPPRPRVVKPARSAARRARRQRK